MAPAGDLRAEMLSSNFAASPEVQEFPASVKDLLSEEAMAKEMETRAYSPERSEELGKAVSVASSSAMTLVGNVTSNSKWMTAGSVTTVLVENRGSKIVKSAKAVLDYDPVAWSVARAGVKDVVGEGKLIPIGDLGPADKANITIWTLSRMENRGYRDDVRITHDDGKAVIKEIALIEKSSWLYFIYSNPGALIFLAVALGVGAIGAIGIWKTS